MTGTSPYGSARRRSTSRICSTESSTERSGSTSRSGRSGATSERAPFPGGKREVRENQFARRAERMPPSALAVHRRLRLAHHRMRSLPRSLDPHGRPHEAQVQRRCPDESCRPRSVVQRGCLRGCPESSRTSAMTLDKSAVIASLTVDAVLQHFQIAGAWRGHWLRSRRCAKADHSDDAFGIKRDGHWHCWSCNEGGDLLRLVAFGHGIDPRTDFQRALELAAEIARVQDDESFGGTEPRKPVGRPALPPIAPLPERIALAKSRAAWVWDRLVRREETPRSAADGYLAHERRLDPTGLRKLEDLRETPLRVAPQEIARSEDMARFVRSFSVPGIALPVRAVDDGQLVDVRIRRYEPREGQPKIVGMLGGVTVGAPDRGGVRQLVGCYGHPECIDPGPSLLVVVVEGAVDYLTALNVWPDAQVLGAVDAGSMSLVVGHVARGLASYPGANRSE